MFGGRIYDSKAERDRGDELEAMVLAGEIVVLHHQPHLELEPGIGYTPDFSYALPTDPTRRIFEEVKGREDARWSLIRRLWRLHGPGELRVLKRVNAQAPWTVKVVTPRPQLDTLLAACELASALRRLAAARRINQRMRVDALAMVETFEAACRLTGVPG